MREIFAAIDAGTSGVKCVALGFDPETAPRDGHTNGVRIVGHAAVTTSRPAPGLAEVDPAAVLRAARGLIDQLLHQARQVGGVVRTIGLTGQIGGLICVDRTGQPVAPCMTWEDQRCAAQAEAFAGAFGRNDPAPLGVALPGGVCWPAPKLRWLRENQPGVVARVWKVLQLKDYLFYHLTGQAWSEPTSMMGLANVQGGTSPAVLRWCGVEPGLMPDLRPATATAPMLDDISRAADLSNGSRPQIGIGTADMKAGFWGCDLSGNEGVLLAATAEIIGRLEPRDPHAIAPPGLVRLPYSTSSDIVYGSTTNGGASLNWLQQIAGPFDLADLAAEAAAIPPGSDGLLFVPHLSGARAPLWDTGATGAFLGLRAVHSRAHLLRAVFEACAFSKRQVFEAAGPPANGERPVIKIAGGTARMDLWNQIRASVLQCPLSVLPCVETSALGALFLAAETHRPELRHQYVDGAGGATVQPVDAWVPAYDAIYRRFLDASADYLNNPLFRVGASS